MRKNISVCFIVLSITLINNLTLAQNGLTRITDTIYSYVDIDSGTVGNQFGANAGIIIGDEAVLVVDTLTSAREAEKLLSDIREVTDKPIKYVVNTHYHLDHSLGNCVFEKLGAIIIGHNNCRINTNEKSNIDTPVEFGLPADFWEGTTITPPDITFEKELEVDLGNHTVKFIYPGVATHSTGSVFVVVPSQEVIFTGDILFTDFHPYLGEGDLVGWPKAIDLIDSMNMKYIIPGHGPLSTSKDLSDMKAYLSIFDKNAKKNCKNTNDIDTIVAEMMETLPKRSDGAFLIGANIKMRYLTQGEGSSLY